jgi:excisionase family DNA binding protein
LLAISLRKLDLLIAAKEIAVARFGRSVRIDPRELDRFVDRCSRRGEEVRQ